MLEIYSFYWHPKSLLSFNAKLSCLWDVIGKSWKCNFRLGEGPVAVAGSRLTGGAVIARDCTRTPHPRHKSVEDSLCSRPLMTEDRGHSLSVRIRSKSSVSIGFCSSHVSQCCGTWWQASPSSGLSIGLVIVLAIVYLPSVLPTTISLTTIKPT